MPWFLQAEQQRGCNQQQQQQLGAGSKARGRSAAAGRASLSAALATAAELHAGPSDASKGDRLPGPTHGSQTATEAAAAGQAAHGSQEAAIADGHSARQQSAGTAGSTGSCTTSTPNTTPGTDANTNHVSKTNSHTSTRVCLASSSAPGSISHETLSQRAVLAPLPSPTPRYSLRQRFPLELLPQAKAFLEQRVGAAVASFAAMQ